MNAPPTHYAPSGEASIAYQTLGTAPCDLVVITGPASHLEIMWEEPRTARTFRRMAQFARLIMFDRRGTGLSDADRRAPDPRAAGGRPARGSGRRRLGTDGDHRRWRPGPLGSVRRHLPGDGHRPGALRGRRRRPATGSTGAPGPTCWRPFERSWGDGALVSLYAPSQAGNPDFVAWWGRMQRSALSPGMARRLMQMSTQTSLRDVLPTIQVPTLVCTPAATAWSPSSTGARWRSLIPGARFVEYPSEDAYGWTDCPSWWKSRSS